MTAPLSIAEIEQVRAKIAAVAARATYPWEPASFDLATCFGVKRVEGYCYAGLGLHALGTGPKTRRWSLTHLGSGHSVGVLSGSMADVFRVSTELAGAGDWTFEGITGYKNQFPDAQDCVRDIRARHPNVFSFCGGGVPSEAAAQAIAMARA